MFEYIHFLFNISNIITGCVWRQTSGENLLVDEILTSRRTQIDI